MSLGTDLYYDLHSFRDWGESDELATGLEAEALDQAEQVHEFLLRTPELTASEQAELLGSVVENAQRAGGSGSSGGPSRQPYRGQAPARGRIERRSGGADFGAIARGIQQGLGVFQTGAQIAGGLAGAFGGNDRTAQDFALWANRLGQGAGQVGGFVQAMRGGQAPAFPGAAGGGLAGPRGLQQPAPAQPSPGTPPPGYGAPGAPGAAPGGPPVNATALMGLLLNNPHLIQAIQSAPFVTQGGAPGVQVNVPDTAPVSIPLGAVMNAIAQLAQASTRELNAMTSEGDSEIPEYLLAEDGEFIVDPASADDRAAVVLQWLRLEGEAQRCAESDGFIAADEMGMDESDVWAREAGFDG